ncbi:MAG TPA: glycoside hydrolase family 2 TIM barrel-domain containing protein [Saprospiraceae bacterium]|nr:glycoside hydrolase family 2 TIM barrel-domain containing protein [Saprospiraceae bacterium]HPN70771.1 glycoside hydrolase family 2 TIM barrel-domain containing protein [Saprospiraceae bacterium]
MRAVFLMFCMVFCFEMRGQTIPLPEHPRPDLERTQWMNLNGYWDFHFDKENQGEIQNWSAGTKKFDQKILVPFPWGSKLSEVNDDADVAWYSREILLKDDWKSKRVFINIGASDWETKVWFDGHYLGKHQGGYTPFAFEITEFIQFNKSQKIVIKVDDKRREFTLYGKQGYGNARGIWQTVYLEARGKTYFDHIHFTPDIDKNEVLVESYFEEAATKDESISIEIETPQGPIVGSAVLKKGALKASVYIPLSNPTLWTLENPYLYPVKAKIADDELKTYFGMRKIGVTKLPGSDIPYVSLNNKPIYLQLTLDQSYHPDGFYTFPSDAFMKNEIQLCKDIGLNGLRTHIKVDIPRKLYWADKLGLLVMSDLPNSWGQPDEAMQKEAEFTLREMIKRDYNHPSIFSWIVFNETWGLKTNVRNRQTQKEEQLYLPSTQKWVASMYYLGKSLDPSRLVEDNSICCGAGHTVTDLNSWHEYLPGYGWEKHMQLIDKNTFEGSAFHFENGFNQTKDLPMINSECGNVWGYKGSTGNVDWSYDYHRMINTFRMHPKMSGWLYTEHHDVINEWNGYWRFDRSKKFTGLESLVPGMTDKDFHSLIYITSGQDIGFKAKAGAAVNVPLFISSMTDENLGDQLTVNFKLSGNDILGKPFEQKLPDLKINYIPYMQKSLADLVVKMPDLDGTYILQMILKDKTGKAVHHNFVYFAVSGGVLPPKIKVEELKPNQFKVATWSKKNWEVLGGKKMNGAGSGFFEFEFPFTGNSKTAYVLMELGAKTLFAKDIADSELKEVDYMLGGKVESSKNPNAYPMTDETKVPSTIQISINGQKTQKITLEDDPADHRGLLSWLNQKEDGTLNEAGSYGYLQKITLTKAQIKTAKKLGKLLIRLETIGEGGIAVYGKEFGRYGINPSVVIGM